MPSSIALPGPSSGYNGLAWSEDCELAVARAEHFDLLLPPLKFAPLEEQVPDISKWTRLKIQANIFGHDEISHNLDPLPAERASMLEEQAFGTVSNLAWSPPGVGNHGRSLLGVLTSNLVLSIWDSRFQRGDESNWYRTAVVNTALERYYGKSIAAGGTKDDSKMRARIGSRIRDFAWSRGHACCADDVNSSNGHCTSLLAISNDYGDIVIFRISLHCHNGLARAGSWRMELLHVVPFKHNASAKQLPAVFGPSSIGLQLCWSEWEDQRGDGVNIVTACLAWRTRVDIRVVKLSFDMRSSKPKITPQLYLHSETAFQTNKLLWSPKGCTFASEGVGDNHGQSKAGEDHLVAFVTKKIKSFRRPRESNNSGDETLIETSSIDLVQNDGVTAAAFTSYGCNRRALLHYTTHLSKSADGIKTIGWPFAQEDFVSLASGWTDDFELALAGFTAKHDLRDDQAMGRLRGLAAARFGAFVASSFNLEPRDMLSYMTVNQLDFRVNLSCEQTQLPGPSVQRTLGGSASSAPTSDALLFTLVQWLVDADRQAGNSDKEQKSVKEDLCAYLQSVRNMRIPSRFDLKSMAAKTMKPFYLVHYLRNHVWSIEAFVLNVVETFIPNYRTRLFTEKPPNTTHDFDVRARLANLVLSINPANYTIGPADLRVLKNYTLFRKLHIKEWPMYFPDPPHPGIVRIERLLEDDGHGKCEVCDFCGYDIKFEDFKRAPCQMGHPIPRCAMTLDPIQAPGRSKFCSMCRRAVLSNGWLLARCKKAVDPTLLGLDNKGAASAANTTEATAAATIKPPHLVEVLVTAFDTCLYCGGKFYDHE